ncbi:cytokinin dehydrogenase 4-like isoform X2 [Arachis duranensis]|uniref:cytokinin dehydrogenase n=1 Tax=Arachis duranensis TaxID=130453 RepID=A0A9C6TRH9_ARADU|nr:cytokinin dehydrogenase 4-like isoform X2 [Arachis duranensis]
MARFSMLENVSLILLINLIIITTTTTTVLTNEIITTYQSCSAFHPSMEISNDLDYDNSTLTLASTDYGLKIHEKPLAVLQPKSITEISELIKVSNSLSTPFTIAARGQAHSVYGQAMAREGIVVNMTHLNGYRHGKGVVIFRDEKDPWNSYADVGGEQVWDDVLNAALEYGLTPLSFTDSLGTSVGGTLVNAGIGAQVFKFGPQIANVYELDVITGKGDLKTCSAEKNSELFYGVLGGLGQFGIITRARIALGPAYTKVKWLRLLYSDFSTYSKDQEYLISLNGRNDNAFDAVEGFLMINQWPNIIDFFPTQDLPRINSLLAQHNILYVLELAKYYDNSTEEQIDQNFLHRYESAAAGQGLPEGPKSWLDTFVPGSRISDINEGVFKNIVFKQNLTANGIILIFPMNRTKWNDKMSVAIPDEEVFYLVSVLQAVTYDTLKMFDDQKNQILEFYKNSGIKIKQYLPRNKTHEEWIEHFGSKWQKFEDSKNKFDPKRILAPGQGIFQLNNKICMF